MFRLYSLVAIILLRIQMADAQMIYKIDLKPKPCDIAAMQISGNFKKVEDNTFAFWDKSFEPAMTLRTDRFVELLKEIFAGPKGFRAEYQRSMSRNSFVAGGPRAYQLIVPMFPYHAECNINKATNEAMVTKSDAGGETDLWTYINVNDPGAFFVLHEKVMIDGQQHTMYTTHPYIGVLNGQPLFGSPEFLNGETWSTTGNVWMMFTRKGGEEAFIQITRETYLKAILGKYDEQFEKDTSNFSNSENNIKRELEQTKQKAQSGDVNAQKLIAAKEADLKNSQAAKASWIPRITKEYVNKRKLVTDYLQSAPADSLKLPCATYSRSDTEKCEDWFNPKSSKAPPSMFYIANHAYWRTEEDKAAAQCIVLRFRYDMGSWQDVEIKKIFQKNFRPEKLQAMLDK